MSDYLHSAGMQPKNFGPPPTTEEAPEMEGELPVIPQSAQGSYPPPINVTATRGARDKAAQPRVCAPGFTLVDGDYRSCAREYAPTMEKLAYIGDTDMLLTYLYREERRHRVTMPIKACGIDPIVFDNVVRLEMEEGQPQNFFVIDEEYGNASEAQDSAQHVYELVTVDGELYLSCISECLDEEYLHRVIMEATTTMRETGSYIFRMVGLRRLAVESDNTPGRLLETLRLNTFEMSALCAYMGDFDIEPSFEIIDGHQCICFRSK